MQTVVSNLSPRVLSTSQGRVGEKPRCEVGNGVKMNASIWSEFLFLKVLSSLHANSTNSFYQRKTTPTGSLGNDVWETSAEIPYWWRITTLIWIVLLIGCTFALTNQEHYPQLGSEASSVWNFCGLFSGVISRGNCWLGRKMSAVFSCYICGWSPSQ